MFLGNSRVFTPRTSGGHVPGGPANPPATGALGPARLSRALVPVAAVGGAGEREGQLRPTQPDVAERRRAEPSGAERSRVRPSGAERSRVEPSRAEHSRVQPS